MMPYSVFKRGDASSISLSEGVAQDLPEETRPQIGRVVTSGFTACLLPPHVEQSLGGPAKPWAGARPVPTRGATPASVATSGNPAATDVVKQPNCKASGSLLSR